MFPKEPVDVLIIGSGHAGGMAARVLTEKGIRCLMLKKTGRLTSISNAVVREITIDQNTGLANGCDFVDRLSHREMQVKARVGGSRQRVPGDGMTKRNIG